MSEKEELVVAEALEQLRADRSLIGRVTTPIISHFKGRLAQWPQIPVPFPVGQASHPIAPGMPHNNYPSMAVPVTSSVTGSVTGGPPPQIVHCSPLEPQISSQVLPSPHPMGSAPQIPAMMQPMAHMPAMSGMSMDSPTMVMIPGRQDHTVQGDQSMQAKTSVQTSQTSYGPAYTYQLGTGQPAGQAGQTGQPGQPGRAGQLSSPGQLGQLGQAGQVGQVGLGYMKQEPDQHQPTPPPMAPVMPNPSPYEGGWRNVLLTATSLVLTQDSRRKLRHLVGLLKLANKHLNEKIDALQKAVDADAEAEGVTPKISAVAIRQDIVATVRKSIMAITMFTSSALPEVARGPVRNMILALPARWASRADDTVNESAALSLAIESLETIRNVTAVLSNTLDRADAWCQGLGKRSHEEIETHETETDRIDRTDEHDPDHDQLSNTETTPIPSAPVLIRQESTECGSSSSIDSASTLSDSPKHSRKASRNDY